MNPPLLTLPTAVKLKGNLMASRQEGWQEGRKKRREEGRKMDSLVCIEHHIFNKKKGIGKRKTKHCQEQLINE